MGVRIPHPLLNRNRKGYPLSSVLMDNQVFDNEIAFCKVFTLDAKQQLERVFLRHRISYFVEWQDKSFFQRIFTPKGNRISCTIRINRADFRQARELVKGIKNVKVRSPRGMQDTDAVKDLRRKKESADGRRRKKQTRPSVQKTTSRRR